MGVDPGGMGDPPQNNILGGKMACIIIPPPQYFTVECHIIPTKVPTK